jgi:hypothetical protein
MLSAKKFEAVLPTTVRAPSGGGFVRELLYVNGHLGEAFGELLWRHFFCDLNDFYLVFKNYFVPLLK